MITAPMMFAQDRHRRGEQRCFFCGAYCDETHSKKQYVKDTFTNRDVILFPASEYVCEGCVMSLGDGWSDMPMIDGSVKTFTTARGMAPRLYSWFITPTERLAFTKAHIAIVREMLTDEASLPEAPFSFVLADSGQKQLIFRAPVAHFKSGFYVMLEDQKIYVVPNLLAQSIVDCTPVVAALGKPALLRPLTTGNYVTYHQYHGNIDGLDLWAKNRVQPIAQLAAWLAPNKEEAQNEYPANQR